LKKVLYLKTLRDLKKYINEFSPDIVHAHFSSSYGLLGALSGFSPYFISVWGADVYDFPKKSFLHRFILRFNLSRADKLFSTSNVMANETKKYTSKELEVIPFGVDLEKFKQIKELHKIFPPNSIVIGSIKALEDKYGMNVLIDAFAELKKRYPSLPLKLLLVGRGTRESSLKDKVAALGLNEDTVFTGFIPVETVPLYQNLLDIAVFPSVLDSESFGVSVIEANACGKPVVVSDKGGLPEVVKDGVSGFVVPANDVAALAGAIEKLINDPHLRTQVGLKGRERVKAMYDWKNNLVSMIKAYEKQL
jgi:glycosyltransferase involved in cell wall biosynthesis